MTNETPPCNVGDRIRLDYMPEDPDPIPVGTEGVVTRVTRLWKPGEWQVSVKWDISRSLRLIIPKDIFTVIQPAPETTNG